MCHCSGNGGWLANMFNNALKICMMEKGRFNETDRLNGKEPKTEAEI